MRHVITRMDNFTIFWRTLTIISLLIVMLCITMINRAIKNKINLNRATIVAVKVLQRDVLEIHDILNGSIGVDWETVRRVKRNMLLYKSMFPTKPPNILDEPQWADQFRKDDLCAKCEEENNKIKGD